MPDPADPFETWLLHRVAEAVEGDEVSATLLTDLHAAIAEARARPPEARDALALMDLAERFGPSVNQIKLPLTSIRENRFTTWAPPGGHHRRGTLPWDPSPHGTSGCSGVRTYVGLLSQDPIDVMGAAAFQGSRFGVRT